ncbi:MAG: RcpC/CpaB family pilus assembly protein [Motilibacteraceae bacterium]
MTRRLAAVLLAVALAVTGTAGVFVYVRAADTRAVRGQQPVPVYVARAVVPAGTTAKAAVDKGLLVQESIAAKGVPSGAMTALTPANQSLVAAADIPAGQLVLSSLFAAPQAKSSDPVALPPGTMAVAVELQDPARVGSFLQPGAQIAIFDTFNVRTSVKGQRVPSGDKLADGPDKVRATRLLIDRVQVIGVGATGESAQPAVTTAAQTTGSKQDQQDQQGKQGDQQVSTSVVTVAVTQEQAERLIHVFNTGTLSFALLGAQSSISADAGVDDLGIFSGR